MPDVDYLVIDDTEVEPGAPILSSLGVRWRDNAIAIAQGAPGAPRIDGQRNPAVLTGGIQNGAVTQIKLATNAANRSKIQTGTNSVSGALTSGGASIIMNPYSFFPTFDGSGKLELSCSTAGGTGPDAAKVRLFLAETEIVAQEFNVSWRFVSS